MAVGDAKGARGGRRRGRSRGRSGGGAGSAGKRRHEVAPKPKKGKAFSTPYEVPPSGNIAPFDLFCACYLGLMPDGSYRNAGLNEVAKRIGRSPNELRGQLQEYRMDAESLKEAGYDISLAKLDIQVAPEGIDRRELARGLFEELLEIHPALEKMEQSVEVGRGVPQTVNSNGAGGLPPEEAMSATDEAETAGQTDSAKTSSRPRRRRRQKAAPELVTADAGAAEGKPTVRNIRRSPTRRGGGD